MALHSAPGDKNFPTLSKGLARYLASGESSDMKIKCGDHVHNVHRMIVCTQSSFFANALKEEHNFKEAPTRTVELNEDDPAVVLAAIQFMYMGRYYTIQLYGSETQPVDETQRVDSHLSVYFFADRFGIGGLREYCAKRIKQELEGTVKFSPDLFFHTLQSASANTPENDNVIRSTLIEIGFKNFQKLSLDDRFLDIAGKAGMFGAAVLKRVVQSGRIAGPCKGVPHFIYPTCDRKVTMVLSLDTEIYNDDPYFKPGECTHCPGCGNPERNDVWEANRKHPEMRIPGVIFEEPV
ncbi:hypothetical protein SLS58_003122 [Diplodia intermedia]|uniref:BTB domain-containing protein n=1 Tax=Diplodia intermedia TaxID=856260 RepID=A0ABR3TXQ6_9PEZI